LCGKEGFCGDNRSQGRGEMNACRSLVLFYLLATVSSAALNDPFCVGYSMANNGTIMQTNGISGRQPWIPACFFSDSSEFGLSICGIDYYDLMDDPDNGHIGQVVAGGWYALGKFVVKGSYAYFNAMDLYGEHQGYCSIGYSPVRHINASIEVSGLRAGLLHENETHATLSQAGASLLVYGKTTAISLSCKHVPLQRAALSGFDPPLTVSGGIHASFNRYGSQGIVGELTHDEDWTFRFSVGEEYCWNDYFSLCGAVATNPFTVYFGCTIVAGRSGIAFAMANHPILGWSKGLTLEYAYGR